jgi:hypothetical protein
MYTWIQLVNSALRDPYLQDAAMAGLRRVCPGQTNNLSSLQINIH